MNTFTIQNFELQCGAVLPEAQLVYQTYGELRGDQSSAQSGFDEDLF